MVSVRFLFDVTGKGGVFSSINGDKMSSSGETFWGVASVN